ncbi:MAG: DUF4276 family protein [Clostridium sp.]|nr:DUF4276 family protein [Clostridium sp.]
MVIRIYAEGGVLGNNENAATMANSAALREELNRFMSEALGRSDLRIIVQMSGGFKSAASLYSKLDGENTYLYVDLDHRPEHRDHWFTELSEDGIVLEGPKEANVFFWIQEMEAWFLKQPDAIESWAESEGLIRKPRAVPHLSEHPSIKGKNVELLPHKASVVLENILKQTYLSPETDKNGKPAKVEYGKLRHAPDMIARLDVPVLIACDNELRAFVTRVLTSSK